MSEKKTKMSRRKFFTRSTEATAAIATGNLLTHADLEEVSARVNTNSQPSELKITDLRLAHIRTPKGYGARTVVRIDTNQGISGYSDIETGDTYLISTSTLIVNFIITITHSITLTFIFLYFDIWQIDLLLSFNNQY